jgi:predicted CxxxxCH...CXXCH cytochrome family protein
MAIRKNISEGTDRGIHPLPGPETGVLSAGKPVCKKRHLTVKTCILLAFIMILMAGFGAVADAATTFTVTACTDCHTYPPTESATRDTPTGAVVGSHAKHNDESIACTTCHVDTTSGETDLAHRDGNIDLNNPLHSGSGAYSKGSSFAQANDLDGSGLGTCSNIYCHSNIQTVNGTAAADTYGTPSWGGSSLACDTCHGQDPDETDGMPASGSHNLHAGSQIGELNYACTVCHNNGGSGNANHANDTLNMDIDNTYGASAAYSQGDHAPGSGGYGSCSSVQCHGSATDTWGTDLSSYNTCTKCHGEKAASPSNAQKAPGGSGFDTNGDSAATDAQVGAHQVHMTLPSGIITQLNSGGSCNECHKVPSAVSDAGHNDTALPAEVFPGTINPEKADLNSVTPSYSAGTCTVYCHGADLPGTSSDGADTTPAWNDTGYLTGVAANDCAQCHGYPPSSLGVHSGKGPTDCINCHDSGVNAAGTGFTDASAHINGTVNLADDCSDCHSSRGGPTPGTTPDAAHAKHVQTAYVGTVSGGDYGDYSGNNWYAYSNTGGVPDKGCGFCHPQSSATHMNGTINLNLDPNDTGAAGTLKAKNNSTQSYTQVQRTSVTCSSVYCHSSGYDNGSGYEYKTSPEWYAGSFVGNKCDDCHGNMPDTSSHMNHGKVGIHYETIYDDDGNGLLTDAAASGAGHGDPNTSTTINCNLCHYDTVTVAYNDQNTVCNTCHAASPQGDMVIDASATTHVTGVADVVFAPVTLRSKAQIRDDITTVTELNTYWQRNNGYKAGASSHDSSKATLSSTATYNSGTQTCSAVACHNGVDVNWDTNISSCQACHIDVPRTDQ